MATTYKNADSPNLRKGIGDFILVRVAGIEPTASWTPFKRAVGFAHKGEPKNTDIAQFFYIYYTRNGYEPQGEARRF